MNENNQNNEAAKKLADQFNSQSEIDYKLITLTIQDINPVTFSAQCEEVLKKIVQESLVSYNIQNVLMNQKALVFIANIQFWADPESHKEWIEDIKRKNMLIKL